MKSFHVVSIAIVLSGLLHTAGCSPGTDSTTQSGLYSETTKTNATSNSTVGEIKSYTDQEILAKLKVIIKTKLGINPDSIQLKSRLEEDLGADPLAVVEICMEIDKEFNIGSERDCERIKTVKDAIDVIKKHLKEKR